MPPAEHAIDELEERVLLRLPVVAFIPQPPGGARRVLTCLGAFHPRPERRSQLLRVARRIGDGGIAEHWREQRLSRRSAGTTGSPASRYVNTLFDQRISLFTDTGGSRASPM